MKQYGWTFVLGVIVGRELARLVDKMPMITQSLREMREMFGTTIVYVDGEEDD